MVSVATACLSMRGMIVQGRLRPLFNHRVLEEVWSELSMLGTFLADRLRPLLL